MQNLNTANENCRRTVRVEQAADCTRKRLRCCGRVLNEQELSPPEMNNQKNGKGQGKRKGNRQLNNMAGGQGKGRAMGNGQGRRRANTQGRGMGKNQNQD